MVRAHDAARKAAEVVDTGIICDLSGCRHGSAGCVAVLHIRSLVAADENARALGKDVIGARERHN